jgi:DNA polymerase-3 subunit delta
VPLLRTSSLFSGHTLVLYHGAEQIKNKGDVDALTDFMGNPGDGATLVLITEENRLKQSWAKKLPEERRRIFWEMFDNQKKGWVAAFCRRRSVEIEDDASELLLELVENNTLALSQELERLCEFVGRGGKITGEVVESYLYHSKDESVFTLFDYVATGHLEHALEIGAKLLRTSENNPIQLLGGLTWQLRRLRDLRALLDQRYDQTEALSKLNIRTKRSQRIYGEGARRYKSADLDRMISLAADYDAELRSGLSQWGSSLLEQFLYYCVVKRGVRPVVGGVESD